MLCELCLSDESSGTQVIAGETLHLCSSCMSVHPDVMTFTVKTLQNRKRADAARAESQAKMSCPPARDTSAIKSIIRAKYEIHDTEKSPEWGAQS